MADFDPKAFLLGGERPSTLPARPPGQPRPEMAQVAPPPSSGFDPQAFLAEEAPEGDKPSKLESAARGLAQGVSLGFGDELTGLVESAFTSKTYDQAVAEARKANKAAQEANPWTYGGLEVVGGIGAGLATGGTGLAARAGAAGVKGVAALAAAEGAVQGIGTAEGSVGEHLKSALLGGVVGGAAGAVGAKVFGKYASTAPQRVDDRAFIEMTGGPGKASVPPSLRDPMIDNKPGMIDLLDSEGFRDVYKDPAALKDAAGKVTERLGSEIEAGRSELTQGLDLDYTEVRKELEALQNSSKFDANKRQVQKLIDSIDEKYNPKAERDLSAAAGVEYDGEQILKLLGAELKRAKTPQNVNRVQTLMDAVEDRWIPEKPLDDRKLLQKLTEGGKVQTKTKLAVKKETALEVAKKFGLDKAVRNPAASKEATDQAVTVVGQRISELYDKVDGVDGLDQTLRGMDLDRVIDPLDTLVSEYAANPATQTEAGKVRGLIENMRKVWGGEDLPSSVQGAADMPEVPKKVLARQLRELVTTIQSRGFGAGDVLDPDAAKQLQRDIATRLKGTLDDYLDDQGVLGDISDLNKEISVLLDFQKAADKRAAAFELKDLPPAPAKKTGKLTAEELNQLVSELPQDKKTMGRVRERLEELLDSKLPKGEVKPPVIPAADLDTMIREISDSLPRKPKIISTKDDIDFGKSKPPKIMEKARDRLQKLLESKLPKDKTDAIKAKESKKELVNLAGGGAVYRERADVGRKTGLRTIVGEQTAKGAANTDTTAAVVTAAATMNPFMLALKPVTWTGRKVVSAAGKLADKTHWKASEHLAQLKKAADAGNVSKQQYLDALKAGVAGATALGVVNTMKNRPAWLRDFDGTND